MPYALLALGVSAAVGLYLYGRSHALGFKNGTAFIIELVPVGALASGGTAYLNPQAAAAYVEMATAAAADGVFFVIDSAFRSTEEQTKLYLQSFLTKVQTAKPGYSNHQAGDAVDIDSGDGGNAAFRWLTQNAAYFNFKRTVPSEPWHWEFVVG